MELRQLDTLLAIADSGSFSGAADLLHTVQSNVSGHIQQLEEALVGLVPHGIELSGDPVAFVELAALPLILPPIGNPVRLEVETAASEQGLRLHVPIEVEGIRLIADLVAAGGGASILPRTAV